MKINVIRKKVYGPDSVELKLGEQEVPEVFGASLVKRGLAVEPEKKTRAKPKPKSKHETEPDPEAGED